MIRLHQLRMAKGFTQQELAARSGISQGVISYIESGMTQNPRFETMAKLADALGCRLEELMDIHFPPIRNDK